MQMADNAKIKFLGLKWISMNVDYTEFPDFILFQQVHCFLNMIKVP